MTQDEIFNMAVKCYLISTGNREGFYGDALIQFAKMMAEKALKDHAMQEVQRLGQEIEQEPVELCQYGQEPASCTSNPMDCQCAIDAALAQPEQEPVAWFHPHKGFYWAKPTSISAPTIADVEPLPLYTHPPKEKT